MHTTNAGEKAKAMKVESMGLARDAKAARKAAKTLSEAGQKAKELEDRADQALAESEALKSLARLEDLTVWEMRKTKNSKKGSRSYGYWMATWRECGKVRNVHLGSCRKLSREQALSMAKKLKAEALGLPSNHDIEIEKGQA
jgi:hypothetical protein